MKLALLSVRLMRLHCSIGSHPIAGYKQLHIKVCWKKEVVNSVDKIRWSKRTGLLVAAQMKSRRLLSKAPWPFKHSRVGWPHDVSWKYEHQGGSIVLEIRAFRKPFWYRLLPFRRQRVLVDSVFRSPVVFHLCEIQTSWSPTRHLASLLLQLEINPEWPHCSYQPMAGVFARLRVSLEHYPLLRSREIHGRIDCHAIYHLQQIKFPKHASRKARMSPVNTSHLSRMSFILLA